MPALNIERLTLRLSGLSKEQAGRLARLVAEGLAATPLSNAAGERTVLQSSINAAAESNMQQLSDQIVADLVRQLERSS
ncbi:MAG TPA: hypothetical protein VI488_10755 [Candidatus Angelobacter sp.]